MQQSLMDLSPKIDLERKASMIIMKQKWCAGVIYDGITVAWQ